MTCTTKNGFDVTTENEVFTLVCDNQFWYVKHKHRGTCQIGVRDNCIVLIFDTEQQREEYITINELTEFINTNNTEENENM